LILFRYGDIKMSLVIIKIVNKSDASGAAEARGELEGGGFSIVYEGAADAVSIDATRAGNGEQDYDSSWIIIGEK